MNTKDRLRLLEKAARNPKSTVRTRNISTLELEQGGYCTGYLRQMETDNKSPAFELANDEKNHSIPNILTTTALAFTGRGDKKHSNWYCFATILDHRAIEKVRGIFFYPGVSLSSSIGGVSLERILQP